MLEVEPPVTVVVWPPEVAETPSRTNNFAILILESKREDRGYY